MSFLKSDKLVCQYQDYGSEEYTALENITINFRGKELNNVKYVKTLTFDASALSSKVVYLQEFQNQFDGMGFDASYIENDNGFEINMNLTKNDIEKWTGEKLSNTNKEKLLKELNDSGYICE